MNLKLCFCVNSPRSGSTLLTRILNSHTEIASSFEIPIARYAFGSENERLALDKTFKICSYIGVDFNDAINDCFKLFYDVLQFENKKILVIKEPMNSLHLLRVFLDYHDVPLIFMYRDVRSVMDSKALEKSGYSKESIARMWCDYNESIIKSLDYFTNVHSLRYEDLVNNPEFEIKSVLRFLDCDYQDGMLEYWNFKHTDSELKLWDGQSPENCDWSIDLFKNKIEAQSVRFSEDSMGLYERDLRVRRLNEALGYK